MTLPALPPSIVNRAIDQLPGAQIIGAITDGTTESEAARRIYGATLRQLLRAAHWSFARKNAPLLLLGDRSGKTLAPNGAAYSTAVEPPWLYAYAWPNDGVRARWLPWLPGNVNGPLLPIMPNLGTAGQYPLEQPARFLVSSSEEFPVAEGEIDWDNLPDLSGEGVGLTSRRIVLTDAQNASLVYTRLVLEIEMWDGLFTEAMVALLASRLAMPLVKDMKMARQLRDEQIAVAREAILHARVANANDGGFPKSTSYTPDWIAARTGGGSRSWGQGGGPGVLRYGYDSMSFSDGSVM